jgi:uncharacterized membrane protein YdjX (TVP38/TMEM64 family)
VASPQTPISDAVPERTRTGQQVLRWVLPIVAVVALLGVAHGFVSQFLRDLPGWIAHLGVWGPVGFGGLYVMAVIALVPASVLTLAAGALFGVPLGLLIVSLASNIGAAAAFLIARYLAREPVRRWLLSNPKLEAVDRAVEEGGWKLVALLRLSPAVPFNIQNYLYGVTSLRFWPCVLTSWLAMLPGTLLYVVLGDAGRAGLEAAGGSRARTPAEWAVLAVGVAATVALSVYIARLVRRRLGAVPAGRTDADPGRLA